MKGKFRESYTKKSGLTVFVYFLQGTTTEIEDYKHSVGSYFREDNGKPLFYTLFYYGKEVILGKAKIKGNYFVKNDEFDKKKSVYEQLGKNLFQILFEKTKDENWKLTEKNELLLKKRKAESASSTDNERERTFERYSGSYAQDYEGYSDQDIDDIFEGDPDLYWNID